MNSVAVKSASRSLLIRGTLLVGCWFVPDFITASPVFPIQSVATVSGLELIALLTPVLAGALLILSVLSPLSSRIRAGLACVVGGVGTLLTTLPENSHLPVPGPFAAYLSGGVLVAAGVLRYRFRSTAPARTVVALLPIAALLTVLIEGLLGSHSFAYVVSFKTPFVVYLFLDTAIFSLHTNKESSFSKR